MCDTCEEWISLHGLIEFGGAKRKDYCKEMGIDEKTHRNWMNQHTEYKNAVERAKETFRAKNARKLFGTLMEAAQGGKKILSDEITEYRPNPTNPDTPTIRKQIRKKREIYIKPDVAAGIFLLCNFDPEHFQNRQRNDISIKKPDEEIEMTIDEVNAEIERLNMFDKKE